MATNLYRRHRRDCKAGHLEDSRSGEFEERKRNWKRCECQIHASGTLAGKFKRLTTGRSEWTDAREVVSLWEAQGSWTYEPQGATLNPPAFVIEAAPAWITNEKAVEAFTADHVSSLAPNTQRKYRLILNKLRTFAELKGYVLLNQWTPMDVREFRAQWQVSAFTASKNLTVVKSFFEFCLANEWIVRNPARLVKSLRGQTGKTERIPFSDEELSRMYTACDQQYGKRQIRWSREIHHKAADGGVIANYRYRWTGQDLADFISVSVYTGLRISDVCTFHGDRLLDSGECHIRTTKTGRKVYTWIPPWLQGRIRARVADRGPLIFGAHDTTDINVITDVWRRKLNKLWNLCGPWIERPTPHRFRHTFARILLQKPGVTIRDVAELLGDTEEIVIKHYSAWVPERQERITKLLQEAFVDKPTPNVISIR